MYFLFINYSTDLTTSFEDIDWEYNKINFFLDLKKITDAKKYCSILKYSSTVTFMEKKSVHVSNIYLKYSEILYTLNNYFKMF